MLKVFFSIIRHEVLLAYRHKADWVNAWLFFILVVVLFPLAVTSDGKILKEIAPGVIWIAALLSMNITLPNFLRPDFEDGSLQGLLLSPYPLTLLLSAKIIAHWLITAAPLLLLTPLLGMALQLSLPEVLVLFIGLLLGTPIFALIGSAVVGLTLNLSGNGLLLNILLLPLCVPVLIFGTGAVLKVENGLYQAPLALLAAMLVLGIMVFPWVVSMAVRSAEY